MEVEAALGQAASWMWQVAVGVSENYYYYFVTDTCCFSHPASIRSSGFETLAFPQRTVLLSGPLNPQRQGLAQGNANRPELLLEPLRGRQLRGC